ncbi:MAG: phytanoyl-CoA dioxygenase family protein [Cytophagaceae bacterium]|jgi:ectoine hydroxylase-related dioxygenase (phytanoyl-CoA dioxygenase family)|nr:phytanoyl-CoA dioxygenase family protein [Cytophagaceae bacterium]
MHINEVKQNGFSVVEKCFTPEEVLHMQALLDELPEHHPLIRRSEGLYAIRQVFKLVPALKELVAIRSMINLLEASFQSDCFLVKSIYFDKPPHSNWFVSYHQDLSISVDRKVEIDGFQHWTQKFQQFGVQPPIRFLENMLTVRIHLDDTDSENGALRVIPGSHTKGFLRPEEAESMRSMEQLVPVGSGGIMLMKPLLMHASSRSTASKRRRVLHLEFSNQELPGNLRWSERENLVS